MDANYALYQSKEHIRIVRNKKIIYRDVEHPNLVLRDEHQSFNTKITKVTLNRIFNVFLFVFRLIFIRLKKSM